MPICFNMCAAGCRLRHKHPSDSRRALRALRQYDIARLPMNEERVTLQVTRPLNALIGDASVRSALSIFAKQIHAKRSGTYFGRYKKSTATEREVLIERNEEKQDFYEREVRAFYRPNVREPRASRARGRRAEKNNFFCPPVCANHLIYNYFGFRYRKRKRSAILGVFQRGRLPFMLVAPSGLKSLKYI